MLSRRRAGSRRGAATHSLRPQIQPEEKLTLASFEVVRLDEIEEIDDGRAPFRPVRHRLGITTFGVTASTAHADGSRLINEHDGLSRTVPKSCTW